MRKRIVRITLLCIFVLSGCQTVRYVPIEIIKKEYSDKYFRDSVYLYDSVIVKEKGDTFLLEKYKYLYKNKYVKDSVFIRDSIQVPYPVVEFKEVNKVTGWQNFQIWSGRILLSMISLVVLFFFVKRRFF